MRRTRIRVKPYHPGSRSARALARNMGVLRLRPNTYYVPRRAGRDLVINWGCPRQEEFPRGNYRLLNKPYNVSMASDKVVSLTRFTHFGVPCPDWTTDREVANGWVQDGQTVVCRSLTRGSSGRGIVLVSNAASVPNVPLYTKYVKKRDEYRVFVFRGEVCRVSQKRLRGGSEGNNFQIRNTTGGWVYCMDSVASPRCVDEAGVQAVQALGLDFGAVDVGYNAHHDAACVYEVNTAFGMEGSTLELFSRKFKEYARCTR